MAELNGQELTRAVAERLGWTNLETTEYSRSGWDGHGFETFFVGEKDGVGLARVPDFAADANAALTLIPPSANVFVQKEPDGENWYVSLVTSGRAAATTAKTLATAICRAWLEWRDGPQAEREDVVVEAEQFLGDEDTVDDMHALVRGLVDEVKRLREAKGK